MESQHRSLLERIKNWAIANDNVLALVMTGSHARGDGKPDELSDLDVEVIADRPDELTADGAWLKKFGGIMVSQFFDEGQEYPTRLVLYESGAKVDFTLASRKRLTDMTQAKKLDSLYERGYTVIVDKHGIARDLPSPSGQFPVVSPDQQKFTAAVEEFWFEAAHIPKYLIRDELWVAKFRDWTMKTLLLKMLEWRAVTKGKTPVDVWYIGSHIKEWVDLEIWGELQTVFSHFDSSDSWRGLLATTELFRRVALETAEQAGLVYPTEVDASVTRYIASFEGKF